MTLPMPRPMPYAKIMRFNEDHRQMPAVTPHTKRIIEPNAIDFIHIELSKLMVEIQPPKSKSERPIMMALFSCSSSYTIPTRKTATSKNPEIEADSADHPIRNSQLFPAVSLNVGAQSGVKQTHSIPDKMMTYSVRSNTIKIKAQTARKTI